MKSMRYGNESLSFLATKIRDICEKNKNSEMLNT